MSNELVERLREVLAARKEKNPSYSLRAFAKHLGISPTLLSQILNGKEKLSSHQMISISEKLGFSLDETMQGVLVNEAPENSVWKQKTWERLEAKKDFNARKLDLQKHQFTAFSKSWVALLCMLFELPSPPTFPEGAAQLLGVSSQDVERAIEELLKCGAIQQTPKGFRKTKDFIQLMFEGESKQLIEYNRSFLKNTIVVFDRTTPEERVIGTELISMDEALLDEARQIVYRCLDDLVALSIRSNRNDSLYQVGIQMLPAIPVRKGVQSA